MVMQCCMQECCMCSKCPAGPLLGSACSSDDEYKTASLTDNTEHVLLLGLLSDLQSQPRHKKEAPQGLALKLLSVSAYAAPEPQHSQLLLIQLCGQLTRHSQGLAAGVAGLCRHCETCCLLRRARERDPSHCGDASCKGANCTWQSAVSEIDMHRRQRVA